MQQASQGTPQFSFFARASIKAKVVALLVLFGLLPALVVFGVFMLDQQIYEEDRIKPLQVTAININNVIDRNLFERYGDVQAFASNPAALEAVKGNTAPLERIMNGFMHMYGVYNMMLLLDTQGNVIATNTQTAAGTALELAEVKALNFAAEPWFKDVLNGEYLEGSNGFTGTSVYGPHRYPWLAGLYNPSLRNLIYAAPVKDAEGATQAYWINFADFALVEEIIQTFYQQYAEQGIPSAEITLLDKNGVIIADFDPSNGKDFASPRDFNVLGQYNLAANNAAAALAVAGESGVAEVYHTRKGIMQLGGYAHSNGAYDYAGMGWSTLIRVPADEILATLHKMVNVMLLVIAGLIAVVAACGYFVGRSFALPLQKLTEAMNRLSGGDLTAEVRHNRGDEIGQLQKAYGVFRQNAIEKEEADRQAAIMTSCLTGLKNNVMIADTEDRLTYMNTASKEALMELAPIIRDTFPDFNPEKIMGQSIHQFHQNPDKVRTVLGRLQQGHVHTQHIKIGHLTLVLNVGPIMQNGTRVGSYAEWRDVTQELAMKEQQDRVIQQVTEVVGSINDATRDIAQGNLNLSERTEAQAASIEETTATMQQITDRVNENARDAQEALDVAKTTRSSADRGGEVVQGAIGAMREISASSEKINDIIGVIDEIAFQTNLLALNAAVEAARAGEQGRGFAVVASEVRTLAGRSAEAAREIKDLITESVERVRSGTEQVNETGSYLSEIIENVQKVSDMMSNISGASNEQAVSIAEINKSVAQMDSFTQQNAALVEQAAAASKALEEQASMLVRIVKGDMQGKGSTVWQGKASSNDKNGEICPVKGSAQHNGAGANGYDA